MGFTPLRFDPGFVLEVATSIGSTDSSLQRSHCSRLRGSQDVNTGLQAEIAYLLGIVHLTNEMSSVRLQFLISEDV
jgi:hypothetical protein